MHNKLYILLLKHSGFLNLVSEIAITHLVCAVVIWNKCDRMSFFVQELLSGANGHKYNVLFY